MTGQCASYFHRTGRFLPSARPKIAAAPAEKNEQHDDQNNQRSIVHELSLSLIKTKPGFVAVHTGAWSSSLAATRFSRAVFSRLS
jgi:hypothetical protein